jgi:hypothetical protein
MRSVPVRFSVPFCFLEPPYSSSSSQNETYVGGCPHFRVSNFTSAGIALTAFLILLTFGTGAP